MKPGSVFTLAAILSAASALNPIIVKGNYFFDSVTNQRFYVKGIAYQPSPAGNGTVPTTFIDPLADSTQCTQDFANMKSIGINVIRVYSINNTVNHDACMKAADAAGIYVIADLSNPIQSIISNSPAWTADLFQLYANTIDNLGKYSNTLAFFAGNEVIFNDTLTDAAPFVKAAVRDSKAYIKSKISRPIPVGYAAVDDPGIRINLQDYFACNSTDNSIDFYGINIYEWCGQSTFSGSGYSARTQEIAKYPVPAIFSEFGCNTAGTRTWQEVGTMYSSPMSDVWSGGIAYEYFPAANQYGMTTFDLANNSYVPTIEFYNLGKQLSQISPPQLSATSYTPSNTNLPACPTEPKANGFPWLASNNLPPTPQPDVCSCMMSSLSCVATSTTANNPTTVGQQLGYICGLVANIDQCTPISANGTTGVYGNYSYCSPSNKLSYEYNVYYLANKGTQGAGACSFANAAQSQNPSTSSCGSSSSSTGVPSGVGGGSTSGSSSSSGSGSKSAGDKTNGQAAVALWAFVGAAMAFGAFAM